MQNLDKALGLISAKYLKINHLNVSREACLDFEKFIDYVLKKNEILNIIAKSTQKRECGCYEACGSHNKRERNSSISDRID